MNIIINKSESNTSRQITFKCDLFKVGEYIKVRLTDKLIIQRATIDYTGKTHRLCKKSNGYLGFSYPFALPLGKFKFEVIDNDTIETTI